VDGLGFLIAFMSLLLELADDGECCAILLLPLDVCPSEQVYLFFQQVNIDFETEPIGIGKGGKAVFLRDIWPSNEEVAEVWIAECLILFVILCTHCECCWGVVI
jgi:hypothetical protein